MVTALHSVKHVMRGALSFVALCLPLWAIGSVSSIVYGFLR